MAIRDKFGTYLCVFRPLYTTRLYRDKRIWKIMLQDFIEIIEFEKSADN